jgi:hypothetical protein
MFESIAFKFLNMAKRNENYPIRETIERWDLLEKDSR